MPSCKLSSLHRLYLLWKSHFHPGCECEGDPVFSVNHYPAHKMSPAVRTEFANGLRYGFHFGNEFAAQPVSFILHKDGFLIFFSSPSTFSYRYACSS